MNSAGRLLEESLGRFLGDRYAFARRRALIASDAWFSPDIWRSFAEMGLLGAPFAAEHGGSNDPASTAVIMRAFGRRGVVEPYPPTVILGGGALRHAGSEAQKNALIPRIVRGELMLALAFAEPASRYNLAHVATTAARRDGGFVVNGRKSVVLGGPTAAKFVVSARTSGAPLEPDGLTCLLIDADATGLARRDYRTIDGASACELTLRDVSVPPEAVIGEVGRAYDILERVIDEAAAATCAEALGAMEAAFDLTLEHCRTRKVFGQPLARLQVVRHQLVDMRAAIAQAEAMVQRVFDALDGSPARRAAAVSAAKVQLAREMGFVGKTAVQLHGAMGITEEAEISHLFKRLTVLARAFGDEDHHLRRFIARSETSPNSAAQALEQVTDIDGLDAVDRAFRDRIRRFFDENLTDDLRRAAELTLWHMSPFEAGRRWQRILFEHGYGAPEWPVEHGGRGWTPTQLMIWNAEAARARAPRPMGMGRVYCGPCIMKFGDQAQKDYFLPRILSGEDWWAQGYSEPGAGADLAALQLSARSDGDDYVLNGSKIWTTFAHHANRIFCLVRTGSGERRQDGISFLLIDMDTPGIEVRPIRNLAGDHDFNQVFFTDVRVPKSRLLGEENQGWTVARHLLLYEHGANLLTANIENLRRLGWLREIAALEQDGFGGRLSEDADFSRHLAAVEIELLATDFACRQAFALAARGEPPGSHHELLTLRSRIVGQRLTELCVDALGWYGGPDQAPARRLEAADAPIGPAHALLPTAFYLTQRGATIAGGPPEAHKNNLAKRLLGL